MPWNNYDAYKTHVLKFQKILLANHGRASSGMDVDEGAPNQFMEMKQNQPMSSNGKKENSGHAAQHDTTPNGAEQNFQEHPQASKQTA